MKMGDAIRAKSRGIAGAADSFHNVVEGKGLETRINRVIKLKVLDDSFLILKVARVVISD